MLWDAATFQPIGAPMPHGATVRRALFSPDGRRIATASLDKTARIWDAQTGQPLCEPLQHGDQVWTLAISPDGRLLATASHDKTARLWSMIDGSPVGAPMEHDGPVDTVAFSPDGARLVTASRDKTVRLWDVKTCKQIGERMRHDDAVFNAIFSPDGSKVLSVGWDHAAYLWDAQPRDLARREASDHWSLAARRIHRQSINTFSLPLEGRAGIWSLSDNRFVTPVVDHGTDIVTGAVVSFKRLSSPLLAPIAWCGFGIAAPGRSLAKHRSKTARSQAIVFSIDGSSLFTAYLSGLVVQSSVPDGKPLGKPITHPEYIDAIAVAPSGKEIATGMPR